MSTITIDLCLNKEDDLLALSEIHEGICVAHQAEENMKWILHCHLEDGLWTSLARSI